MKPGAWLKKAGTKSVFAGLAFVAFFLPFYSSLTGAGIGLVFLGTLGIGTAKGRGLLRNAPLGPVFLFFGASLLASITHPATLPVSAVGLRKSLLYLFVVAGGALVLDDKARLKQLLGLILASALLAAADAHYQLLSGRDFFSLRPLMTYPGGLIIRVTGPFKQAALLAIYLECVLAGCAVFIAAPSSRRTRLAATAAGALLAAAILLTLTPASLVVLAALFVFLTIAVRRPGLNALFLALPAAFWSIPPGTRHALIRLLAQNLVSRGRMFLIGARLFLERPFLGHGLNTFSADYAAAARPGDPFYGAGGPYAHDMYLQLACETGLVGLAAFLGLAAWLLHRLLKPEREDPQAPRDQRLRLALALSLIAYLIHGLFESSLQTSQGALIFWVLTGLAIAAGRRRRSA
ncbi:MAG: O-antigen ligase family protein [Deltaproteobacteria bacterium]